MNRVLMQKAKLLSCRKLLISCLVDSASILSHPKFLLHQNMVLLPLLLG